MRMDTNVVIKHRCGFKFRNLIRIQGQVLGKVVWAGFIPHDPRVIYAQLGYPRVGAFASVAMTRPGLRVPV